MAGRFEAFDVRGFVLATNRRRSVARFSYDFDFGTLLLSTCRQRRVADVSSKPNVWG